MYNINEQGRYGLIFFLIYGIFICVCREKAEATGPAKNPAELTQDPNKDRFKTKFVGDLIELDINCKNGYNKFNCLVEHTKVTYQSNYKFKKVSDGSTKIWESGDKGAFRVVVQFLGPIPLTVAIELDRNDKTNSVYYLKKYNSQEWEESDAQAHDKRVADMLKALEEFKKKIKELDQKAVDLDLKVKNNEFTFKQHSYKDKDQKISQNKDNISIEGKNDETFMEKGSKQSEENNVKKLNIEMKPEYRIAKLIYDPCICRKNVTIWETGGSYYCVKVDADGEGSFYTTYIVEVISNETFQRFRFKYETGTIGCFQCNITFEEVEKKELPPFDFKY